MGLPVFVYLCVLCVRQCNHMTCNVKSCRHEWCWICGDPWAGHGGSVYECNRYKGAGPKKNTEANRLVQKNLEESKQAHAEYDGFIAQEGSRKLELKYLNGESIRGRMKALKQYSAAYFLEYCPRSGGDGAGDGASDGAGKAAGGAAGGAAGRGGGGGGAAVASVDIVFVYEALLQLQKCRWLLRGLYAWSSYAFGQQGGVRIDNFGDRLRLRLEREYGVHHGALQFATETLSGMVARTRWRNTRAQIVAATLEARNKRRALKRWMRAGPWSQESFKLDVVREGIEVRARWRAWC